MCALVVIYKQTDRAKIIIATFTPEVLKDFNITMVSSVIYIYVLILLIFVSLQLKAAVLNSDLKLLQETVVQFDSDLPEFRCVL
jgi:hypothetical protein